MEGAVPNALSTRAAVGRGRWGLRRAESRVPPGPGAPLRQPDQREHRLGALGAPAGTGVGSPGQRSPCCSPGPSWGCRVEKRAPCLGGQWGEPGLPSPPLSGALPYLRVAPPGCSRMCYLSRASGCCHGRRLCGTLSTAATAPPPRTGTPGSRRLTRRKELWLGVLQTRPAGSPQPALPVPVPVPALWFPL